MENEIKVALITGAGSGIGREVAIALSQDGWVLVLAGRRKKMLQETADGCANKKILVVPTDINDPNSIMNLFNQALKTYGRLDLLFNNAGVNAPAKPLEELSLEEWNKVIDTNLTGAFLCAQHAVRTMKNQNPPGGRIINNGSLSAQVPRPNSAAYTASKHAVTGLTKAISLEGREFNITCGQIDVGNASSAMTRYIEAGALQPDGTHRKEPTMSIKDVARTVVFMASLPPDTNIPSLTVMASQMPFAGRG